MEGDHLPKGPLCVCLVTQYLDASLERHRIATSPRYGLKDTSISAAPQLNPDLEAL